MLYLDALKWLPTYEIYIMLYGRYKKVSVLLVRFVLIPFAYVFVT